MAWDIDSTPTSNPRLKQLRHRLLLSYLIVTGSILGIFSVTVYSIVARDRHHQFNLHLEQMATTSAASLELIQHEYSELMLMDTEHRRSWYPAGAVPPMTLLQMVDQYLGKDYSPTATPNDHTSGYQGVEWFNAQGELIVREGTLFPSQPLPSVVANQGLWRQQGTMRSFILPVYETASGTMAATLIGYVRVNESTQPLDTELRHLKGGLGLGALLVSALVTLGGVWLTRQSLQPVLASFEQLKQFTADASHELRNPLTAIRASVAVIQSHPERIHPANVDKLKAIASASVQMSQLVDDLLLLARMDQQALDLPIRHPIALDELLEDLVNFYEDRAVEAQIELRYACPMSLTVAGDAAQLQRLFTNLLVNALQYTPKDGTVTLEGHRNATVALVTISDTGCGIAPDQLPYIFDRFWQADSSRSRSSSSGSAGLGLAIAQAIAQYHQGTITVESQLGQGSCFQVRLPLA